MKTLWTAAALAAVSTLWIAHAQEPADAATPQGGLTRVQEAPDVIALRTALVDQDLDARERAFDDVVRRASREPDLERALREWSADPRAGELAWTARLALREVERAGRGLDPFRAAPFRGGPFRGGPFRGGPLGSGGGADPFQELHERMQRMLDELQMGDPLQGLDLQFPGGMAQQGTTHSQSSRSVQIQQTPDGVEVEVTEDDGSGPVKKTYKAATLEELYAANPELRDQLGVRIDMGRAPLGDVFGNRTGRGDLPDVKGLPAPGLRKADPGAVSRTDRLGIYLAQGATELEVQSVEPNTLAAALRLRAGDVVLEIDGTPVKTADDVRAALARRAADADLRVTVRTPGGDEEVRTWVPPGAVR